MTLVRLGDVIYWLGCILAILIIAAAIPEWLRDAQYHRNGWIIIFEFAVFAAIVWLIGLVCRYILSHR